MRSSAAGAFSCVKNHRGVVFFLLAYFPRFRFAYFPRFRFAYFPRFRFAFARFRSCRVFFLLTR